MSLISRCSLALALLLALLPVLRPPETNRPELPRQVMASLGTYADQTISGDPLAITGSDDLSVKVFRDESGTFVQQYYSTYNTYVTLTDAGGSPTSASGPGGGFTAVSSSSSANQIVTTVSCADNVWITQTIDYSPGATLFTHTWTIANHGATSYSKVDLRYGGDTYFHGSDSASGAYDSANHLVYCFNPNVSGFMGMYADAKTPATHYYEDQYGAVTSALGNQGASDLPDTVNPSFIDNGMGLQWVSTATLIPSGTITIVAYEKWDAGSLVQVVPPAPTPANPGKPVTVTFTVDNLQTSSDTFSLLATCTPGLSITSAPSQVSIGAAGTANVSVQAAVSTQAANSVGSISLTATSQSDSTIANQNNVDVVVAPITTTNTTTVPIPPLPISHGSHTVYLGICPGTPEGVANLVAAFTAHGPDEAVAYAWDATAQRYALLPAQPSGGLLPSTGFFVASRVPIAVDFLGTLSTLPFTVTLQPGWNLVGMPPLDNGGTVLTTHSFPGDFELLDGGGALVTTIAQFVDTLGTVGSANLATTRPFWYDGTTYHQAPAMQSGLAYWIKNNAAQPVTLRRTLTPATLSIASRPDAAAGLHSGGKGLGGAVDRGQPPSLPASADSASGTGCGHASGAVGLVGLMLLAWRRRTR